MNDHLARLAVRLHASGFNCAESALAVLAPESLDQPHRAAAAFGAGLARRGLVCGCITGSLMALGLHLGRIHPEDQEGKERLYALAEALMTDFERAFGSLLCRELTGTDFRDPEAAAAFLPQRPETCDRYQSFCVNWTAKVLAGRGIELD